MKELHFYFIIVLYYIELDPDTDDKIKAMVVVNKDKNVKFRMIPPPKKK